MSERRVTWTDPATGQEFSGRIVDFDPDATEHDILLDDGGEVMDADESQIEFS